MITGSQRTLERLPEWLRHYVLATLALLVAVGVAEILLLTVGTKAGLVYVLLYFVLIGVGAWLGYGPGLLICVTTTYLLPPLLLGRPPRVDPARFGLLVVISLLISKLAASKRQTEASLKRAAGDLEDQVRERTAALERNDYQLREQARLLDLAPDAIITTDQDGTIQFWSQGAAQIYGWQAEEAVGQPAWDFLRTTSPESLTEIETQIRLTGGWRGEITQKRKDGSSITIMTRAALRRTPAGEPCGTLAINTDVTEKHQVEEQLRHSQRLESIGLLAGGVAHDFNNLLTVINGYCEMAMDEAPPDSNMHENLTEIRAAGERASGLTSQLLAFSRKQLIQPAVLNLNHVVTDIQKMLNRLIGEHIEVATHLSPSLGSVMADVGQLQQIIMNLAVNARDAMPQGGKLTIETANVIFDEAYTAAHLEVRPGPYVMLAVTDTGLGMAPEVQKRVFEPFFTTKPKGTGTGLGLATVYGMVKQSNGWIWVYSEPGRGASFKVYLPRTDEAPQVAKAVSKSDLNGNEMILVVEDQAEVRRLAAASLERRGYHVFSAASGEEALAFSRDYPGTIHVLLTDVVMPGMAGRELADRLLAERPNLRLLFMSGYTEGAFSQVAANGPEFSFLQKPFTPDALAEKVRDLLGPLNSKATILAVDDDVSIRRMICKFLVSERYTVIEAVNGRQALEQLSQNARIDLVITDLVMPELEGIESIQVMKSRFPKLKVIAISGAFEGQYLNVATKLGADATLQKPLSRNSLCDTVNALLADRPIAPPSVPQLSVH